MNEQQIEQEWWQNDLPLPTYEEYFMLRFDYDFNTDELIILEMF